MILAERLDGYLEKRNTLKSESLATLSMESNAYFIYVATDPPQRVLVAENDSQPMDEKPGLMKDIGCFLVSGGVADVCGAFERSADHFMVAPIIYDSLSDRLAYGLAEDDEISFVIDSTSYGPYGRFRYSWGDHHASGDHTDMLQFGPEGRHFAFMARRGDETVINIDGTDVLKIENFRHRDKGVLVTNFLTFPFVFDGANRLFTYAIRDGNLVRIIINIEE